MQIGTPLSPSATRVMLLGAGELGKEVIIALQRLGVEVIAVDRYENTPGHQVAHRAHVISMTDGAALRQLVELEKPQLIVPEIEAIATDMLVEIEAAGLAEVIPTARAAKLTMNREGIRRLAAEELSLPTSQYQFADSLEELQAAIDACIGYPCIVKPTMSSSGKGQSLLRGADDVQKAWDYAASGGRVNQGRVIVEGFIDFDYEITLLTFSEFELHARAILGLPVDTALSEPGASAVIYGGMEATGIAFKGVADALAVPRSDLRLFGKPESFKKRRMGVAVANGDNTDQARERAKLAASKVRSIKG